MASTESPPDHRRKRIGEPLNRLAKERDGWTCVCCGLPAYEAHHIEPFSLGGPDTLENLATLCAKCHDFAPADPDRFLDYQAAGGGNHPIWSQVSHEERAERFLSLPWAPGLKDLEGIGLWRVARQRWEDRLCLTTTTTDAT